MTGLSSPSVTVAVRMLFWPLERTVGVPMRAIFRPAVPVVPTVMFMSIWDPLEMEARTVSNPKLSPAR